MALLVFWAGAAHAVQYPPGPDGPGGNCDAPLPIADIQDTMTVCNPAVGDTVLGVGGIITGFDSKPTGFAIYMQNNASGANGAPWTGIDVFTGGSNIAASLGLALGDSIVVDGKIEEFQNETEILSPNSSFSNPNIVIIKISSGNALPPFHVGTVAELKELPNNPNAEQWEGCLVRVNGPLRVVRTSPGIGTSNSFLAVDSLVCPDGTPGPCDSLFVDGNTLATVPPPAVGTTVSSVQGIYNQRSRGYRIQLRDQDDLDVNLPPSLVQAYPVHNDTIRAVFSRKLEATSAQNRFNYITGSLNIPDDAIRVEPNVVHLYFSTDITDGTLETLTASGIVDSTSGLPMPASEMVSYHDGVLTIAAIQAPDKAALFGGCEDRSVFAGPGSAAGNILTYRGIVTNVFGNLVYIEDTGGGARSALVQFAPITPMTVGRQYLVAAAVQEFFNETEGTFNVYLRDEGPAAIPAPASQPAAVLADGGCDSNQVVLNGEDFEDVLVTVDDAYVLASGAAGSQFRIRDKSSIGSGPPVERFLEVLNNNNNTYTYAPVRGHSVKVTGVLRYFFGRFTLWPRGDSDIVDSGLNVGVGDAGLGEISFSVHPNPARTAIVSFGLPRSGDVELSVFDVAGRQVATLARGSFKAGKYSREWNGLDAKGNATGSGVYFYRLRVGEEVRVLRAIRLN